MLFHTSTALDFVGEANTAETKHTELAGGTTSEGCLPPDTRKGTPVLVGLPTVDCLENFVLELNYIHVHACVVKVKKLRS